MSLQSELGTKIAPKGSSVRGLDVHGFTVSSVVHDHGSANYSVKYEWGAEIIVACEQ